MRQQMTQMCNVESIIGGNNNLAVDYMRIQMIWPVVESVATAARKANVNITGQREIQETFAEISSLDHQLTKN